MRSPAALQAIRVSAVLLCGATAIFCSSSSSSSSSDASNCGPGPYAKVLGHVAEFGPGGNRPKEDVKMTFSICPDKSFTSDTNGTMTANITKGVAMTFTAEHPDEVPASYAEWRADADFEGSVVVVPKLYQAVVAPDFGPDKTLVAIGITYPLGTFDGGTPDGGPTDPCQRSEGVTVTIPDHPEAKVTYFTTDAIPKPDPMATATSKNGIAAVSGLADGVTISPVATKAGCRLTPQHDGFTGRAVLKKGFGTFVTFVMTH